MLLQGLRRLDMVPGAAVRGGEEGDNASELLQRVVLLGEEVRIFLQIGYISIDHLFT